MPTRDERITEMQEALKRHKSLALLQAATLKHMEQILASIVDKHQAIKNDLLQVEREIAEAEQALAQLESQAATGVCPSCSAHYYAHEVASLIRACPRCGVTLQPPVGTDAAPESPQSNQ